MMVPATSAWYQISVWPCLQTYHESYVLRFGSSMYQVRTLVNMAILKFIESAGDAREITMDIDSGGTHNVPRLMATQRPTFSYLSILSFHVTSHGNRDRTKSMMMLNTAQDLSAPRMLEHQRGTMPAWEATYRSARS